MRDDARSAERRSPRARERVARSAGAVRGTSAFRLTQRFDAPASRVFDAWVDPDIARRWLFATASRPVARAKMDARAGRFFSLEDQDVVWTGRYLEVARPRRLVF